MFRKLVVPFIIFALGCGGNVPTPVFETSSIIGAPADSAPTITFTQNGPSLGLRLQPEPPSASSCPPQTLAAANGTHMADFNGDGILDVYNVAHGQTCHNSGLWLGNGTGGFGPNIWTVAVSQAPTNPANIGTSIDLEFLGDLTGDGKVDLYFLNWSGIGTMCVNQGNAVHADWTGPSFLCYANYQGLAFGDINGDGKIDVETFDPTMGAYDNYKQYARTLATRWHLNNGSPNINTWAVDNNPFNYVGLAGANTILDLNNDGYPDKVTSIEAAPGSRGPYGTYSAGIRIYTGAADLTYHLVTSGIESVVEPIVKIKDVNDDGCLDLGTDVTGYKDNLKWYVQTKTAGVCMVTFGFVARTALPFNPGARYIVADVDNDGLMDRVSLIHNGYGNNDGQPCGAHVYRHKTDGTYQNLNPSGTGLNFCITSEYYADSMSAGDWNNDGKLDLSGTGAGNMPSATADPSPNAGAKFSMWTSTLTTTNKWLKVALPTVNGFFAGTATVEIFDVGFVGDVSHLVTPAFGLTTGNAWVGQSFHFGVGTRTTVDVKVTFPNGQQTVQTGVGTNTTILITPTANIPPVASFTVTPPSGNVSDVLTFDGTGSSDSDGTVVGWTWSFGDGGTSTGSVVTHAYVSPGVYVATLTVTDDNGSTHMTTVNVGVADVVPPTISVNSITITPNVSDNVGVLNVIWSVDGMVQSTITTPPYAFTFIYSSGTHTISCQATDTSSNVSAVSSFDVVLP